MENAKREIPVCEVCQQPANQICGGCRLVYYCSKGHQKLGWKEGHKFKCCAFKIDYSEKFGRHMVATRNIKQGEIILKERPAVSGPRTSSPAHCLSCAKKLQPEKIGDKYDFYKCSSCNWPMCGMKCEKAEIHRAECRIMQDRKYRCNINYEGNDKIEAAYCVITPLRVLLMKESDPRQYENIMNMESHLNVRINTPLYVILKANLVTFIVHVLGLPFQEEFILRVASILDTNAFDVRSPDGSKRCRSIYVTASMINHSCKPNTRHIFLGDEYIFTLIATTPIDKGELIKVTYTQTLWGTLDRRRHLFTSKCFECNCERCQDSTELGTYLGSIYCSYCNGPTSDFNATRGAMMLSTHPLDESAPWKCQNCNHTILSKQMFWGNNALKKDLTNLNKHNPHEFEDFILKHSLVLHPNNHLMIQAKLALAQIYGNDYRGFTLSELPDHLLQRKIDLCNQLLEVVDVLEPGWTKIRGTLLLDLQAAVTVQTKRDFESEKITKEEAQKQLTNCLSQLQEATNILKVEPHMREVLDNKLKDLAGQLDSTDNSECLSVD